LIDDENREIKTVPSFDNEQQLMMFVMIRQEIVKYPLPTIEETSLEDKSSHYCDDRQNQKDVIGVSVILNESGDGSSIQNLTIFRSNFEDRPVSDAKAEKIKPAASSTPESVMAANEVSIAAAKALIEGHKKKRIETSVPTTNIDDLQISVGTSFCAEDNSDSDSIVGDPILKINEAMIDAANAFVQQTQENDGILERYVPRGQTSQMAGVVLAPSIEEDGSDLSCIDTEEVNSMAGESFERESQCCTAFRRAEVFCWCVICIHIN
jgi:hypothetical protein